MRAELLTPCLLLSGLSVVPLWRLGQAPAVQAPTTTIARDSCVTSDCHSGVKDFPDLHGPVRANACEVCHSLVDPEAHSFVMTRNSQEMCSLCHELELPASFLVHKPLEGGECLPCHNPHGGTTPKLLRGRQYADLCSNCHEDQIGGQQLVHGPASAGACRACHEPHASKHRMLLPVEGRELCLRCHISVGIELDTMHVTHAPALGDCRVCHDPHATESDALLREDPVDLCTSCHEDIAHRLSTASTQHAAVVTERACLNCHSPHASDHPSLLRKNTMELCLECHDKRLQRYPDPSNHGKARDIVNMKQLLENSTSLHGPAAQRNCVACHQIHGSEFSRLLQSEYSAKNYLPFKDSTYALCFTCHDRQAVLLEETDAVTSFRNGTTNLHYVHVHRDEKGRTCRVCHDSHAANREHHIRSAVPFGPGGWELPINWVPSPDGGACAGACHPPLAYSRSQPVDYSKPPASHPVEREGNDQHQNGR